MILNKMSVNCINKIKAISTIMKSKYIPYKTNIRTIVSNQFHYNAEMYLEPFKEWKFSTKIRLLFIIE